MTAFFLPRFVKKWWRLYKTRDVHNVTMSQYVHLCAINFRICSLFCVYIIVVREENDGSFCRTQGLTIPGSSLLCALVFVTEEPMYVISFHYFRVVGVTYQLSSFQLYTVSYRCSFPDIEPE